MSHLIAFTLLAAAAITLVGVAAGLFILSCLAWLYQRAPKRRAP